MLCEPRGDLDEDGSEVFGRFWTVPQDGEVEILGEAVGLVVALAEAGPAFEGPPRQRRVGGDTRQEPPKGPVLLDDV